jgi:hypothetical protein
MNHYKYIVLTLQDMASSDLIGSAYDYEPHGDYCRVSKPIEYCIPSDDLEELLRAKQIMEDALNCIYMCKVSTNGTTFTETPAFVHPFAIYNINLDKLGMDKDITNCFRKLPKGRFQVSQSFNSKPRQTINIMEDINEHY